MCTRIFNRIASLVVILAVWHSIANAQPYYQWARDIACTNSKPTYADSYGIATDNESNVFITGTFTQSATFNTATGNIVLTATGTEGSYFAKYDSNGNCLWAKSIITANLSDSSAFVGAFAIAVDNWGTVYISGTFNDYANFDPGNTNKTLDAGYENTAFFAKYDPNGNYIMAISFEQYQSATPLGLQGTSSCNGITVDNAGNIFITGGFEGELDFNSIIYDILLTANGTAVFTAKFDPNGNCIWAKGTQNELAILSNNISFGGTGTAIALDNMGNVLITGNFTDTISFRADTAGANLVAVSAEQNIFFVKYDTKGNYMWAKSITADGLENSNCLTTDKDGNVYVAGSFSGVVNFGAGSQKSFGNGMIYDIAIFFAKYDSNGNYIWAKATGSNGNSYDDATGIVVDASGNVYIAGGYIGTADFSLGEGIAYLTASGDLDMYFAKYDADGNYVWAKDVGSVPDPANNQDYVDDDCNGIALTTSGAIYLTGPFSGTADFGLSRGVADLTSVDDIEDVYVAKYFDLQCGPAGAHVFAQDSVSFPLLACPKAQRDTIWVHNFGAGVLNITGVHIVGVDSTDFSCLPPSYVPACDSIPIVVGFSASNPGYKIAALVLGTNDTAQKSLSIALNGEWSPDSVFASVAPHITFVTCSGTADSIIWVYNLSADTITISEATFAGNDSSAFTMAGSVLPARISPFDSLAVHISFQTDSSGEFGASLSLGCSDPRACNPYALRNTELRAINAAPVSVVSLPSLQAYAGDTVYFPMTLNALDCPTLLAGYGGNWNFTTTIQCNATILLPIDTNLFGTIQNGERVITLSGTADSLGTIATLGFIAGLGDTDETPLHFNTFAWTNGDGQIITNDGAFQLLGVCASGGGQYFISTGAIALSSPFPSPVNGESEIDYTTIETGRTQLVLYDILGRRMRTIVDGALPIGVHIALLNAEGLPSGAYLCVLQTPTQRASRMVHILE